MDPASISPQRTARRPKLLAWLFVSALMLLAALALLPLRGEAQRASAAQDTPATRAQAAAQAHALQGLWQAVLGLRNKCAVEGAAGWTGYLTPAAARRLEELNRQFWGEEAGEVWSSFFARSLFDIGRPASSAPLVGFYHPWGDAWLLVEWQVHPEVKITGLELVSGEWVRRRGEPPFDLRPDWLRRDGFRVEQLARAAVENLRELPALAYGKKPWREALQLDRHRQQLDEIHAPALAVNVLGAMLRAEELALGAEAFEKAPPAVLEQLIESCRRFLASGTEGKAGFFAELAESTSPATAETIGKLAPEVFRQLAPAYWLADADWAEAMLVADHNPDFCLALTYKRHERRLQLTRVDLVHFPSVAAVLGKQGGT